MEYYIFLALIMIIAILLFIASNGTKPLCLSMPKERPMRKIPLIEKAGRNPPAPLGKMPAAPPMPPPRCIRDDDSLARQARTSGKKARLQVKIYGGYQPKASTYDGEIKPPPKTP